jgi:hypothetical protein
MGLCSSFCITEWYSTVGYVLAPGFLMGEGFDGLPAVHFILSHHFVFFM